MATLSCSLPTIRKNRVPREELHTCHIVKPKKKKSSSASSAYYKRQEKQRRQLQQKQARAAAAAAASSMGNSTSSLELDLPDLPDLPNYFNNLDENNRLQTAKERSVSVSSVSQCGD